MRKWILLVICIAQLLAVVGCGDSSRVHEEKNGEPNGPEPGIPLEDLPSWTIKDVSIVTDEIKKWNKVEISFLVDGFDGNPFDPEDIDLTGEFTSPSGEKYVMPAFWYQPYQEFKNLGVYPVGNPDWRLRFAPTEVGTWKYSIYSRYKGYTIDSISGEFKAADSDNRGFIRIEPEKRRHFIFDNGEPYIAVGENVCWYNHSYLDYERWYTALSENGGNYSRVWMATWGFALVWKETGISDYTNRLDRAYQLDKVMEMAEEKGIYTALVILNHGQFSSQTNPEWHDNPYNKKNGGYLDSPKQFFTDERAKEQFKKRLRYIVARWGYSTNILTWELWNEVNGTDSYSKRNVEAWHGEMAEYLKSIDPYKHLVSSSTWWTDRPIAIDELDFINVHAYSLKNFCIEIPRYQSEFYEDFKKPVLFSEMGIAHDGNETAKMDPEGIHLHQGLWAGMMGGGAGTGMTWWWDSYIEPYNLYHAFRPVSEFAKYIPWKDKSLDMISDGDVKLSKSKARAIGYKTGTGAYLWIYDGDYSYKNKKAETFDDTTIEIRLDDGEYEVYWFDTYQGTKTNIEKAKVSNGKLLLKMPQWNKDIALVIEKAR